MANSERLTALADVRVALLTNSLSPHTLPLCEGINAKVGEFRAFVSAAIDKFHGFPTPRASFRIVVQRSCNALLLRYRTRQVDVPEQLHLPLDTLQHLFRYRPDVVLSCQFGARTLFAILYCLLRPRTKLILWAALSSYTERDRGRLRSILRRWMLRHADAAFANGKSGADYLRGLGFSGAITTVPYTIDDTLFRTDVYRPSPQHRHLLYCGRIDETKGVLRFFRVLERWCTAHPAQRVHFDIIGGGPDSDAIFAAPIPANLTLALRPRISQAELTAHYHEADLFVFPSLFDEWGVVINEAMSAGLPVLGSIYSQAVAELVREGESGWLFDPEDDSATYAQLHNALSATSEQLSAMSFHARESVKAVAPDRVIARALQTIAEVCGAQASTPAIAGLEAARATLAATP